MKLVINLVTRGRPDYLKRTIERTLPNIALPDTRLHVSTDVDDMPTCEMVHHLFGNHPSLILSIKPREDATSAKYNRVLNQGFDLYGNLSDYTPIVTPGFDARIVEAAKKLPDGIGVIVNPMRNASFSDLYIMTKPMADILGWYAPPYFPYWFWDHWVDELARRIDRMVMCDVAVEYDPRGKPPTQGMRDSAWWATWFDAGYQMRRNQAKAVLDQMSEFSWRKDIAINNAPLHEFRSKWINDNVRAQAKMFDAAVASMPVEDRYARVKPAAVDMVPGMLHGTDAEVAKYFLAQLIPPTVIPSLPKVA
jgi:hypothetical protein